MKPFLIVGICGLAIGAAIALITRPGSEPNAAPDPVAAAAPATDPTHPVDIAEPPPPAEVPNAPHRRPRDPAADETIVYEGHNTRVLYRLRGDNEELVVATPNAEYLVGSMLANGPVTCEVSPVAGGELLVAPFRTGSGTGVGSYNALVIFFPDEGEPAVAQVWYQGYCQQGLNPAVFHSVEHHSYEMLDNTLLIRYDYFVDNGQAGPVFAHEDTVELQPGRLTLHASEQMIDFVFGRDPEADEQEQSEQAPAHGRSLVAVTDERTQWVSIVLDDGDEQATLHAFNARQNIYDMATSPDGRYAYVWHDEYSPRELSIFDLDTRQRITTIVPGVGGTFYWTPSNTICLTYGFGSDSFAFNLYNTRGESIAQGSGTGGSVGTDCSYVLVYPTLEAADHPIRLVETARGQTLYEIEEDQLGRRILSIYGISWNPGHISIQYRYAWDEVRNDWHMDSLRLELPHDEG